LKECTQTKPEAKARELGEKERLMGRYQHLLGYEHLIKGEREGSVRQGRIS
jgi:hypothetical protein